jgi:hypothetical protein
MNVQRSCGAFQNLVGQHILYLNHGPALLPLSRLVLSFRMPSRFVYHRSNPKCFAKGLASHAWTRLWHLHYTKTWLSKTTNGFVDQRGSRKHLTGVKGERMIGGAICVPRH